MPTPDCVHLKSHSNTSRNEKVVSDSKRTFMNARACKCETYLESAVDGKHHECLLLPAADIQI